MEYKRLTTSDSALARQLITVFAKAFEDADTYDESRVADSHLESLLSNGSTIVIVATSEQKEVVGGLVAYELCKLEQAKSEIYLYDLAVATEFRRQGIATALIENLKQIARGQGAGVIFVQADNIDGPAVALYTKLATSIETEITHFDLSTES